MELKLVIFVLFTYCAQIYIEALSFPGPRVYVVTPAARPLEKDDGKFYYHKWMRRMDTNLNTTTTTTTETSKIKTPDLIFAEFESNGNMQKSIRKLLEKEKISAKSTTMSPIYVPDDDESKVTRVVNYGLPVKIEKHGNDKASIDNTDFSYKHDSIYNNQAPVYSPSSDITTSTISTTTTTTEPPPINIENVWHIIDNEKNNQYSGSWQEVSTENNEKKSKDSDVENSEFQSFRNNEQQDLKQSDAIDENFALPGFSTDSGNVAENESRAIRTEPIIRFPYINLKPFQIKTSKKTLQNNLLDSKKNNMLTSLDQFSDIQHPVRGEAQDILPLGAQIDRYNPAQPYLPQPTYGSKVSKQSNPVSPPKTTANLVPPPPPPPKDDDFPAPISYESFPPYAPIASSSSDFGPAQPPSISDTIGLQQALDTSGNEESNGDSDNGPMGQGYRYKPPTGMADSSMMDISGYQYKAPSPSAPQFFPTVPPESKPFMGYSYNKPSSDTESSMSVADKPEFQGYHYSKPEKPKSSQDFGAPSYDSPQGFSYGQNSPPTHDHDSEYPELVFNKPDDHGNEDFKGHDMGMVPPPPPPPDMKPSVYGPPPDDHGFPSDFPTDFKFHHDFEYDHDHYHYHHPTTTTEMPRVNRFSYYYLGKKLYYLPLYFSVYFIVYVGALIIKAVLRHKIVYPNSWRPNTTTATFFSKRSVDEYLSNDNLHEVTKRVTHALATAAEKYMNNKKES